MSLEISDTNGTSIGFFTPHRPKNIMEEGVVRLQIYWDKSVSFGYTKTTGLTDLHESLVCRRPSWSIF